MQASSESEIEAAFATLVRSAHEALLVSHNPIFFIRHANNSSRWLPHGCRRSTHDREYATGRRPDELRSDHYGRYHQAGIYAGRILKGEKPADLPVVQPTKFEFVINLKTAKALGLTIPETLLATADEVIE